MRILVIDDDRVFTEPLIWSLKREGYEVAYCQRVSEVLNGWFEIYEESMIKLNEKGVPLFFIKELEMMVEERFDTEEEFGTYLKETIGMKWLEEYESLIFEEARRNALDPKPDCVILDIMMPRGRYYSREEVGVSRMTGIRLLEDIVRRIGEITTILITVRNEPELHKKLTEQYAGIVKEILVKPVRPSTVIEKLKEVFP